ncbi:hypothetical protein B0T26DRAFT_238421 [Lasiosphaeria miniovina]|uniref:Uncharacterized protein n=1 Tax=Lasiosphaeria miniovina TaxID=1954250 RepID=A0AA40AVN2_9PEZI|nr:uncharacterized protein B0T26DRAFT_238421 [Lasiosphaeria miniovina]KAK0722875.1 hypothetical protein B0T26DRAFT_238421 [Lasiosphaeria miniovina]
MVYEGRLLRLGCTCVCVLFVRALCVCHWFVRSLDSLDSRGTGRARTIWYRLSCGRWSDTVRRLCGIRYGGTESRMEGGDGGQAARQAASKKKQDT